MAQYGFQIDWRLVTYDEGVPAQFGSRMMGILTPVESEFETEEQAASHDRWYRAKVKAALSDDRPGIPHDQVMAEMDAIIKNAERALQHRKP